MRGKVGPHDYREVELLLAATPSAPEAIRP
jgi:hypothetical protein